MSAVVNLDLLDAAMLQGAKISDVKLANTSLYGTEF